MQRPAVLRRAYAAACGVAYIWGVGGTEGGVLLIPAPRNINLEKRLKLHRIDRNSSRCVNEGVSSRGEHSVYIVYLGGAHTAC